MKDGQSITKTYAADSVDAVFFTLDAMDRFAFPYYTRLLGTAYAAKMREEVAERFGAAKPER